MEAKEWKLKSFLLNKLKSTKEYIDIYISILRIPTVFGYIVAKLSDTVVDLKICDCDMLEKLNLNGFERLCNLKILNTDKKTVQY